MSKIRNREKKGEAFCRSAGNTLGKRIHKKLTEKTTWYNIPLVYREKSE